MLLLVVGLVVLVLVIVVVVFLSVRSMHVEDDSGYEMGAARRDTGVRDSAGRDRGTRRAPSGGRPYGEADSPPASRPRPGQPGPAGRPGRQVPAARRRPSGDVRPDPAGRDSGVRRGGRDREGQRVPALPRPRSYEHDQDAGGWGVPDDQYWAELSSDKPLATTARSAPAGPPADRAAAAATQRLRLPADDDQRPVDGQPAGGRQFGDPAGAWDARSGGARFGNGAAPPGTPDTNDTDPGRNAGRADRAASGRDGGGTWGAAQSARSGWADDQPAGSWGTQEESASAWSAADSHGAAWQAQQPSTAGWPSGGASRRDWDAADTPGPSWAGAGDAAGDWRADEPSADRWAAEDEPAGRPAWDTGPAGYEPYGGHRGSGGGYPASDLEPLPEPAGRAADWHSASAPSGDGLAAERDGQGWDDGAGYGHDGYPDADQRNGYAGSGPDWEPRSAGQDWPGNRGSRWTDPGQQGWLDQRPGSGQAQAGGYHPDQEYEQAGGYGEPGSHTRSRSPHRGQDPGYGRASHDTASQNASAYELPAYGTADDGYSERAGYTQPPRRGYGSR